MASRLSSVAILVFGILGLVCCFPFGFVAWASGHSALKEIKSGRRDATDRGLVMAGMVCGIIGAVLGSLGFLIGLLAVFIGGSG